MRLIDADVLLNKIAELEAVALEQEAKSEPLADIAPSKWHRWSGVLQERTAFKYDLMDAPTIEAEPIRHGRWIYKEYRTTKDDAIGFYLCSECGRANWIKEDNYCPNCGAKMDEVERENDVK